MLWDILFQVNKINLMLSRSQNLVFQYEIEPFFEFPNFELLQQVFLLALDIPLYLLKQSFCWEFRLLVALFRRIDIFLRH